MINVIDFFDKVIRDFDEHNKCDFCWTFAAPIENQTANIQQSEKGEECCVHVFLTNYRYDKNNTFKNQFYKRTKPIRHQFQLGVYIEDTLSRNNYNEINGYPIDVSRWAKYLRPLQECFTDTTIDEFCERLGFPINVQRWKADCVANPNLYDRNFVGWNFNITLEEIL